MKKLLLTAFEPFGGQKVNASLEAARRLQKMHFEDCQMEFLELPVERFSAPALMFGSIESFRPDIIIMLGEASSRSAITPERVAINIDDFTIPDNGGNQPREETIIEEGPAAYFSTLPIVAIKEALLEREIPGAISNSAGTYLCNRVFYMVRHYLSEGSREIAAGFIHVPMLPEQRLEGAEVWASMERETMVEGLRVALETCLRS